MIEHFRFGSMTIDGRQYQSDLKIVDGQVVPDWWRREGHWADVGDMQDILDARPEILVVGMGSPGRLNLAEDLRQVLAERKIRLVEEPTEEAVNSFNRFWEAGRKVAGAFHLTC
ncbi:MAG: MTH938/NDUFAF3 family protein [Syntrophobacteraceae bacterium]|jgi:hypothetical protein|nr:MTH938/NDUFAF3 family protein [Syntrophobacteraceae bacterium]